MFSLDGPWRHPCWRVDWSTVPPGYQGAVVSGHVVQHPSVLIQHRPWPLCPLSFSFPGNEILFIFHLYKLFLTVWFFCYLGILSSSFSLIHLKLENLVFWGYFCCFVFMYCFEYMCTCMCTLSVTLGQNQPYSGLEWGTFHFNFNTFSY